MKNFFWSLMIICSTYILLAQDNFWNSSIKTAFGELGYGKLKLSAAGGLRFWNIGVSLGLAGFATSKPKYIYPTSTPPYTLPKEYEREEYKFTYVLVTTDFHYFFDISDDFTISPSLGFFVQQDSVLARSKRQNDNGQLYFLGKTINSTGVNFGAAIDYFYSDIITIGIGYHTKRGFFLRIGYYWF
ncbi:MAG: hypothetical protein ACUVQ1_06825 [Candidatus Kapaibacteriales bacterium]